MQTYLGAIVPEMILVEEDNNNDVYVGEDINWVDKGAVSGVKNQAQCGSCWAFSATGAMESLEWLASQSITLLSEQQLVDCSGSYGNHGCSGGLMDNAFKYVRDKGITSEDEYPYTARQGTCKKDSGDFKVSGFTDIRNCNDLASALAGRPVSVAVDASNWSAYRSGVFSNCRTSLNHGVLLAGSTDQYWLVKNSWGGSWGEKGYIRLARGNTCGICNMASYPNK